MFTYLKEQEIQLSAFRHHPRYWLEEDPVFVEEVRKMAARIRALSRQYCRLTTAALALMCVATPGYAADGYLRAGGGLSFALATSNQDDPEFGTEPGGFGFIEGGYIYTIAPNLTIRAGTQGLYAPKDEHGHNDSGCEGQPQCQHSADGETLQTGAIVSTGTLVYDTGPLALFGGLNLGMGFRSDNPAPVYAYGVEGGVEIPIASGFLASVSYRYEDIGTFNFHGPAIGVTFVW